MNDSGMARVSTWLIIAILALTTLTLSNPFYSFAQINSSLNFSQAIVAVNNAEAAGATPSEILPLVTLLNGAVELNREASSLPANQSGSRDELVSREQQVLANVTSEANNLATRSAQRTYTNKIIAYASGIIVAAIGAFACMFAAEFYQKYRIKRTFQMKVRRT
ncbi:MAG: hypothetical protein ABSF63_06420 [Candidatus Bathyarchaeia archaeon]|jgi:hypothetical protein